MGLIRIDTIITSIVDSYKQTNQNGYEHGGSERKFIVNEPGPGPICDGDSCRKIYLKRGRIPCDSARRQRALLPLAAWSLLWEAYKTSLDASKSGITRFKSSLEYFQTALNVISLPTLEELTQFCWYFGVGDNSCLYDRWYSNIRSALGQAMSLIGILFIPPA